MTPHIIVTALALATMPLLLALGVMLIASALGERRHPGTHTRRARVNHR